MGMHVAIHVSKLELCVARVEHTSRSTTYRYKGRVTHVYVVVAHWGNDTAGIGGEGGKGRGAGEEESRERGERRREKRGWSALRE